MKENQFYIKKKLKVREDENILLKSSIKLKHLRQNFFLHH